MKYLLVFEMTLSALLAHGKEHEHLHLFSSLHLEYFVFFILSLVCAFFVYNRFFKDNG